MKGTLLRLPPNLMIYLETVKGGEDLGWDIERMTGKRGKFNTTQRMSIPLKEILTEFAQELARKCDQGDWINPLADVNLYAIFRTLKSESHTISMDMGVHLGERNGRIDLTAYYGHDADGHTPLYCSLKKLTVGAREALRKAAAEAAVSTVVDPYEINASFKKKNP